MIRIDGPDVAPVAAAAALRGRPGRFLLDSASDADGAGRWCFAGAEPVEVVRGRVGELADPFAAVAALARGGVDDQGPLPLAVGWLGYDLGRAVENLPARARDDVGMDDVWFGRYQAIWRYDRVHRRGCVIGHTRAAAEALHAALRDASPGPEPRLGPLVADEAPERHLAAIRRALEYIRAGDIYQVNLARRLSAPILADGDALALYARIEGVAPAPFGALVETDGARVIADSPELFLRRTGTRLETRPIKGTRARGKTPAEDAALAEALAKDDKELAEHLMIVDLERNDLGRVARLGTVRVEGFARVVSLPTVHHLVSTVACETDAPTADVLRATFPGGSITGAPKVRAMEIIDELEPVRRGVYTGALGWLGAGGAMDLSIVIRTAVLAAGRLTLHVGGGIVADSLPERELEETEEKAAAWRRALESHAVE